MKLVSTKNQTRHNRIRHYISAMILVLLGVMMDQYTKHLAVAHLKEQKPFVIFKNVFELQYLENKGAAFGLLQNQQFFFIISVVIISIVIIWFYVRVPMDRKFLPLRLCAVFVMTGALGNCIDRISQGFVVDFFYFKLINFPIFNVADIYVTVATFLLAFLLIFYYKDADLELIYRSKIKRYQDQKTLTST